jgi:hypothetical protein
MQASYLLLQFQYRQESQRAETTRYVVHTGDKQLISKQGCKTRFREHDGLPEDYGRRTVTQVVGLERSDLLALKPRTTEPLPQANRRIMQVQETLKNANLATVFLEMNLSFLGLNLLVEIVVVAQRLLVQIAEVTDMVAMRGEGVRWSSQC